MAERFFEVDHLKNGRVSNYRVRENNGNGQYEISFVAPDEATDWLTRKIINHLL